MPNPKPKIYPDYYDIVILPPPEAGDYAIELSQKFYNYGASWKLGKNNFLPHKL